jgi:hypothetical protein
MTTKKLFEFSEEEMGHLIEAQETLRKLILTKDNSKVESIRKDLKCIRTDIGYLILRYEMKDFKDTKYQKEITNTVFFKSAQTLSHLYDDNVYESRFILSEGLRFMTERQYDSCLSAITRNRKISIDISILSTYNLYITILNRVVPLIFRAIWEKCSVPA